ncbi:hypothetical protein DAEQUDRAFT_719990 [Daedalea quercina L-15889]|uniref:N-acetyltransferase domain-containing protein n=1 Tax=Daedalea quercina L-15889 TaxID=1314783 RepID=A0A165UEV2_9APHY|nr:hypothetical protein DAEQUDRAFT_719990 [Daedalea quercina L-15889]
MSLLAQGALYLGETPKPELLAFSDLPHTVDAAVRANADDPLGHYMHDTPDNHETPAERANRTKVAIYLMFIDDIRRGESWTINHGDSILRFSPAPVTVPRGRKALNDLIAGIINNFLNIYKIFQTKEQGKRRAEFRDKLKATIEKALSDRVPELISLDGLSTAPERQGLGYASILVSELAAMADAQSRGIWLLTNFHTTTFYARFGFKVAGTFLMGEGNPTWDKDPVVVCIMLREHDEKSALLLP